MMVKIKPGGPFHGADLYGLCDENGNVVVPCEYPYLQYCENGWYVAQNQDGRYGYIDKSGNVMIDFEFEDAEKFSCGLAPVLIDGLWGFINEDGEVVIEPVYLCLLYTSTAPQQRDTGRADERYLEFYKNHVQLSRARTQLDHYRRKAG